MYSVALVSGVQNGDSTLPVLTTVCFLILITCATHSPMNILTFLLTYLILLIMIPIVYNMEECGK